MYIDPNTALGSVTYCLTKQQEEMQIFNCYAHYRFLWHIFSDTGNMSYVNK